VDGQQEGCSWEVDGQQQGWSWEVDGQDDRSFLPADNAAGLCQRSVQMKPIALALGAGPHRLGAGVWGGLGGQEDPEGGFCYSGY